jgi:hypothetical protein
VEGAWRLEKKKKKKKKAKLKKKKKNLLQTGVVPKPERHERPCFLEFSGRECPYGDACKRDHNVAAAIAKASDSVQLPIPTRVLDAWCVRVFFLFFISLPRSYRTPQCLQSPGYRCEFHISKKK